MEPKLWPWESIVASLATKADKIRALRRAGYSRSQIAKFLDIRYQHVRNVLVDDERLGRSNAPAARGMAEAGRPFEGPPQTAQRIMVGKDGEVRVPQVMLDAAGVKEGDALLVRFVDDEIRMYTPATAGRRAQDLVRPYIPDGVSLVDELISERRAEAKRELEDD